MLNVEYVKDNGCTIFPDESFWHRGNSVPVWGCPVAHTYAHPAWTSTLRAICGAPYDAGDDPSGNCSRAVGENGGKSNGFPLPSLSSGLYAGMSSHKGWEIGNSVSPGVAKPFSALLIILVRLVTMWIASRTT